MNITGRYLALGAAFALPALAVAAILIPVDNGLTHRQAELQGQLVSQQAQLLQQRAGNQQLQNTLTLIEATSELGLNTGCPVTGSGPYVSCVRVPDRSTPAVGEQITDTASGRAGCLDTPWQVTDHTGAPMAWVNCFGLYSGGDGGKEAGGLICVVYGTVATSACLTPAGTLQLRPTGPKGPTGPTVTLTARDITWIHAHGG